MARPTLPNRCVKVKLHLRTNCLYSPSGITRSLLRVGISREQVRRKHLLRSIYYEISVCLVVRGMQSLSNTSIEYFSFGSYRSRDNGNAHVRRFSLYSRRYARIAPETAVESLIRQPTTRAYLNSRGTFYRFSSLFYFFYPSSSSRFRLSSSFIDIHSLTSKRGKEDDIRSVIGSVSMLVLDIFFTLFEHFIRLCREFYCRDQISIEGRKLSTVLDRFSRMIGYYLRKTDASI